MTPPGPLTLCPRCGHDLEPLPAALACTACHGVWVGEPEVARRLRERCRTDPGPLTFAGGHGPVLPCPVCWDPMEVRSLEGVTVDRCPKHGLWFDVEELERTLRVVQARLPVPPPRVLAAEAPRGGPPPTPPAPPPRRPAPPRPQKPAARQPPPSSDRGEAWDVLDVLAEIARAVARSLD
jgi:Zn-finger nucleic acid-binding protein